MKESRAAMEASDTAESHAAGIAITIASLPNMPTLAVTQ